MNSPALNRREFLATGAVAASMAATPAWASSAGQRIQGQAEHVISIWLGGGMGQIDTFDPKRKGDPSKKQAGSYYNSIPTAVDGVELCEHLPKVASIMDRVTAVRTVNHSVIDEHAAATNWMHVGRPVSGTVVYPSLGSIIAHERGAVSETAPPYVLIGYPNSSRGPGFLGAQHSYLYLTETGRGPAGLSRPDGITPERQLRREKYLTALRGVQPETVDSRLRDYEAAAELSLKLSGPEFMKSFALDSEPAELRESYGGEFGQRCLLSRRLVQRGVRFIEVSHNLNFLNGAGWDVHNRGILDQHKLIREMDDAVSTLILDLENQKLLDKTLVVITTEFGRPPQFDGGGGRGHQGSAFTCVLAGGGLKHQGAYGETDELSQKIVSDPVSVPDFFATIHASLGIDYAKSLYDGDRPVPITDGGKPIAKLFG
ncbi:DUF1501 domain-containing protein [Bremerella sp. P1]|nr:DUF1501 domain-containing protein [Bremerella sp. P1]WDI43853.1 DUF1501 domain-containing protein [Bremerella sp. P1]